MALDPSGGASPVVNFHQRTAPSGSTFRKGGFTAPILRSLPRTSGGHRWRNPAAARSRRQLDFLLMCSPRLAASTNFPAQAFAGALPFLYRYSPSDLRLVSNCLGARQFGGTFLSALGLGHQECFGQVRRSRNQSGYFFRSSGQLETSVSGGVFCCCRTATRKRWPSAETS